MARFTKRYIDSLKPPTDPQDEMIVWDALLPGFVVLLATLHWPEWLYRATLASQGGWNWSIFPWGLFLAIPLVVRACQRRDPILAAVATPLASPYITLTATAPILALVFRRWPYLGGLLWLASWAIIL